MDYRYTLRDALLLIAAFIVSVSTFAQNYPARPVRMVSPYPPGSSADIIGRIYSPKLTETLGRQFIVDNRAGASGNIAAELVAHATPDGYTLLLLNNAIASSQFLYKGLTFDVARDFAAVGMLGFAAYLLVVNVSLPVMNTQDLIAFARARPGKLTYASTGTGGGLHLTMEMFRMQTGITMLHVPYKGSSITVPEMIGGRIDTMFGSAPALLPHVRTGRIRALGISSAARNAAAPDVPTIAESGVPGFESISFTALAVPAATPRNIVILLNSAIAKSARSPEVSGALANQGTEPAPMTPQQSGEFIRNEIVKWKKVIAAAGVQAE